MFCAAALGKIYFQASKGRIMLNLKTIEIVKATAPVLQEHGNTLTRHFYNRMFSHNPEVLPYFNPANQTAGKQQAALASAICAYAANIDNLGALKEAVELIAQKHASLQIKAEHYPIVGENLLASIREVLGSAATDEIVTAWGKAYGFLADILINREAQIYREAASIPGGWEGFRRFIVLKKQQESSVVTSLYLIPEDKGPLPSFKPGQYITIRVPTSDGSKTMRQYSLSAKPNQDWLRISVKREEGVPDTAPAGYVSNLLHNSLAAGSVLDVAPPCGEFFLDHDLMDDRPLILIAGGIGITPLMSMLQSSLATSPQREVALIHCCQNEDVQAFKSTVEDLKAQHANLNAHFRYLDPQQPLSSNGIGVSKGFIDASLLETMVGARDADYYYCGPTPFLANMQRLLSERNIPRGRQHFEFFGPKEKLSDFAQG